MHLTTFQRFVLMALAILIRKHDPSLRDAMVTVALGHHTDGQAKAIFDAWGW